MSNTVKISCPVCHKGIINIPRSLERSQRNISKSKIGKRLCIQVLNQEGYSIREIAKMLSYKSPSSVHTIITELKLNVKSE